MQALAASQRVIATAAPVARAQRRTTSKVVAAAEKSTGARAAKLSTKAATKATRDVRMRGEYGASGTSFYTTTEKEDYYDTLEAVLDKKCADPMTRAVIMEMLDSCADITEALRSALVSVEVVADEIMWAACKNSKTVKYGASEEEPEVVLTNPNGHFTVCWDPLDGSSIVDNNWSVGTIIGIW